MCYGGGVNAGTITEPGGGTSTVIDESVDAGVDESSAGDRPWTVVVWDDPVNLMTYVTVVFQKVFGYPKDKATKLMLEVHNEGRSAVFSGPLERAEANAARLHDHGLWATLERA